MFEETIRGHSDREAVKEIFYLIRECIIAIYAFLGIPWVVPSGLGIVNVLQREGLEDIAQTSFRLVSFLSLVLKVNAWSIRGLRVKSGAQ
jgi:hypothetical protein